MRMQVLSVASEIFPLIKTGGLADVAGALPIALAGQGRDDAHADPRLSRGDGRLQEKEGRLTNIRCCRAARLRSMRVKIAGLDLFVLDAPHLFDRPGGPYGDADRRRLARQLAALRGAEPGRRPTSPAAPSPAISPTSSMPMTGRRR